MNSLMENNQINKKIFNIISFFQQYVNIIYALELCGLFLNNKKICDLDIYFIELVKTNNILSNISNISYNIIKEHLYSVNLISHSKYINSNTSWIEISNLNFTDNNITHIMEIINHQIKLWISSSRNIFNNNDDKIFIISYLIHKTYGNNEITLRTILKNVFSKLGKYIYTRYQHFITNIYDSPLSFIELLNEFGLNIDPMLLNKFICINKISKLDENMFCDKYIKNFLLRDIDMTINNIIDFSDNDIIEWTRFYDIENKSYNFILSSKKLQKINIICE